MRPFPYFAIAALLASNAAFASPQDSTPEAANGKRLFLRCASCHSVTDGPGTKIGPNLRAVVGRPGAAVPGYGYSPALTAAHLIWDEATLDRWLLRPTDVVPGTSMAFAGMPNPAERQALIVYLKSLGH